MLITKTYQPHITKLLIYITVPQIYDNIINVDVRGTFEKTILKKMTFVIFTVAALAELVISQNGVYGQNAFAATEDTSNGHDIDCKYHAYHHPRHRKNQTKNRFFATLNECFGSQ